MADSREFRAERALKRDPYSCGDWTIAIAGKPAPTETGMAAVTALQELPQAAIF
jgi:hypothetical protein